MSEWDLLRIYQRGGNQYVFIESTDKEEIKYFDTWFLEKGIEFTVETGSKLVAKRLKKDPKDDRRRGISQRGHLTLIRQHLMGRGEYPAVDLKYMAIIEARSRGWEPFGAGDMFTFIRYPPEKPKN